MAIVPDQKGGELKNGKANKPVSFHFLRIDSFLAPARAARQFLLHTCRERGFLDVRHLCRRHRHHRHTDRLEGCGMQARQPLEGNLSGRLLYLPIVMHDQCCAEYFISCKQQFEDRPEVWVNISVAQSLAKQNKKKHTHSVQEKGAHGGGCKMPHLWRLFPCAQQNVNVCRAWCSVGRGA